MHPRQRPQRLGTGVKLINKVIPDFIPEFSVALAEKYEPKLVEWEDEWFCITESWSGVRCLGCCR